MGWQHIHDAVPERNAAHNVVDILSLPCGEDYLPQRQNTTQIVCAIKLRGRLATLLNVTRDRKNISSVWSHTLHEVV